LQQRPSDRPNAAAVAQTVEDHLAGLQRRLMEKQAEAARAWLYTLGTLLAAAFLVGAAGVTAWVLANHWAEQAKKQAQAADRRKEVGGNVVAANDDLRSGNLASAASHIAEAKGRLGDDGDADQKEQVAVLERCLVFARECDEWRQHLGDEDAVSNIARPFAELGLELPEEGQEAEFVARAKALPIRRQIVAALDHFSTARIVGMGPGVAQMWLHGEHYRWMRLARLIAGGPPSDWAQRFRSPEVRFNPEALARLADETKPEHRSVTELHALAMALWAAKKGPGPLLRRSLVLHPNDFFLHLMLAGMEGDLSHAHTAVALRADSVAARYVLAGCLLAQQHPEEALAHLEHARRHHEPNLTALVLRVNCLLALKKFDDAENVWQEAQERFASGPNFYVLRAKYLLALNRLAEAENVCLEGQRRFLLNRDIRECLKLVRQKRGGK
jgi:predicted negative regulator of RcsB-dependent stress response